MNPLLRLLGRTPSTSPPPAPPSHEYAKPPQPIHTTNQLLFSLMQDGLDGDDIYIMVEDEFHAVAKMFTQHLHHAEYVRLKNLAKGRTTSTVSTISRPTDSITAMRNETKKKKEAESRDIRTNAALQQIKSGATRPASDDSGLSDVDVDVEDTHWRGTALQDLMTLSPTKNQISLTGLHGVKSSTRAAAGYSKAESMPSQPRVKAIDLGPKSVEPSSSKPTLSEDSTLDESSTDDLDAPMEKSLHKASKRSRMPVSRTPKMPPPNPSSSRLKHDRDSNSYPTPDSDSDSSPGSTQNSHDRARHVQVAQSEAARRRLKARMAGRDTEREKHTRAGSRGGDRGLANANANDIPVFLV